MPKLLIVDDESDVREFARNFFRKRGIEVFIAAGGREALTIIAAEHPDLVLLDVRMEEMNGVRVLQELRKANDHTRVIIVSGTEEAKTIEETQTLDILGFIHKPLVLEELEKIVLAELKKVPC
jgi:ATP-dependent Lon protease